MVGAANAAATANETIMSEEILREITRHTGHGGQGEGGQQHIGDDVLQARGPGQQVQAPQCRGIAVVHLADAL
jgi:hypothetical protein